MTFDEVLENYPDYLADLNDEDFEYQLLVDWSESGWDHWQISQLMEILSNESMVRGYNDDEKDFEDAVSEAEYNEER